MLGKLFTGGWGYWKFPLCINRDEWNGVNYMNVRTLRNYINNFRTQYLTISNRIAIAKQRHRPRILFRMIACRLLFRHSAEMYGFYNLDDRSLAECAEFIPTKKDMEKYQMRVNPAQHIHLAKNKVMFYERCLAHQIPTPPILGVLSVEPLSLPCGIPAIATEKQLHAFFLKHQNRRLILKTQNGSYGTGILSIMVKNGRVFDHQEALLTVNDVVNHCHKHQHNFIIQPHVAPHPDLIPLMPGLAVGTFRLVTFLYHRSQKVVIPYAFAKVPRRSSIIDNFKHGETGNLLCRVDVETGKLTDCWGKRKSDPGVSRIDRHPDTSLIFRDFEIPYWSDVIALVKRAALVFPELPTLGWDVAITEQGIMVLEANHYYDIDGLQIVLNRGIKSEIKALYGRMQSQQVMGTIHYPQSVFFTRSSASKFPQYAVQQASELKTN